MRLVIVAVWVDASNVRLFRYEDMVLKRYEGKFRIVSLKRRPSTHTGSKALATSKKPAPVSLFSSMFLDTLSTSRVTCSAVLFGCEPKLLIAEQPASAHFAENPGE
jgi:hypothetical protein